MILLVEVTFVFRIDSIRLIFHGKIHFIHKIIIQLTRIRKLPNSQFFILVNSWEEWLGYSHVVIVQSIGLILHICQHNMLATEHEEEPHTHNTENKVEVCLSLLFIQSHLLHSFFSFFILRLLPFLLFCHFFFLLFIFSSLDLCSLFVGVT